MVGVQYNGPRFILAGLEGEGYKNLVSTSDSRRALELVAESRPDLLLLNLMMPNIGGLEILRSMRSDGALKYIPVIILTSSTDAATKLRALELGATDFLSKPVDPSELALRVRNILAAKLYLDRPASAPAPRDADASVPERPQQKGARSDPAAVSRLAGESPRFRDIIDRFVERLAGKLEAMEASWELGDLEELVSLAHWLRGAAGTVGFDAFTAPAEALKLAARHGKQSEIEGAIR